MYIYTVYTVYTVYTYQFRWRSFLVPGFFLNQLACVSQSYVAMIFYRFETKILCIYRNVYMLHAVAHI